LACTTQVETDLLDVMIERLAFTIFGSRSRFQRNEFLRIANYKRDFDGKSLLEQYASLVQGGN